MASKKYVNAFPSAARTASPADAIIDTSYWSGATILIHVSAIAATPSVVFNILGRNPVTAQTWALLSSAAIVGTGHTALDLYPGTDETANLSENVYLPMEIVIDPVHADADSITYSVDVILLP